MSQKVIILGSNPMTRLCLIRSIGEALDCEITIVHMVNNIHRNRMKKPLDCYSKYVSRFLFAEKFNADSLCDLLLKECTVEGTKPYIFSVDDDSACLIDTKLDTLEQYFICANINGEQGHLAALMNKQKQKEIAGKFGFNTAKSWVIESVGGKYVIPSDIMFPCFIKGLLSYHTMKSYQGRYNTREELEKALHKISKKTISPFIAEQFISIDRDFGVIGFSNGQECVAPGIVELLDSGHDNHHGVSAFGLVRNEKKGEDILQKVSMMVESLGLSGLFNFDLVESNNKIYFVEMNLRFAAYGYAVTKAGVNLPEVYIKTRMGDNTFPTTTYVLKESFYINERVALDDVAGGFRTFGEFRQLQKKANFGLLKDENDNRPYQIQKRQFVLLYIKRRIKKILRR